MNNEQYVVACINGMPPSEAVCSFATWIAQRTQKRLKLFHTIDHQTIEPKSDLSGSIGLGVRDDLLEELVAVEHEQSKIMHRKAKLILQAAKQQSEANGAKDPDLCLRHGRLLENLLGLKDRIQAVVIGRYGQNHQKVPEKAVGHKVEAVIRSIEKPILVVSQPFAEPKKILIAYDGSNASQKAVSYLVDSQIFEGLELFLVFVGEKNEHSAAFMNEAIEKLKASQHRVQSEFLSGEADQSLLDFISQNDISLIVMGAFGHHWLRELLMGSFTSRMLSLTNKPLLLIR